MKYMINYLFCLSQFTIRGYNFSFACYKNMNNKDFLIYSMGYKLKCARKYIKDNILLFIIIFLHTVLIWLGFIHFRNLV
jgi:hypothetical protein